MIWTTFRMLYQQKMSVGSDGLSDDSVFEVPLASNDFFDPIETPFAKDLMRSLLRISVYFAVFQTEIFENLVARKDHNGSVYQELTRRLLIFVNFKIVYCQIFKIGRVSCTKKIYIYDLYEILNAV